MPAIGADLISLVKSTQIDRTLFRLFGDLFYVCPKGSSFWGAQIAQHFLRRGVPASFTNAFAHLERYFLIEMPGCTLKCKSGSSFAASKIDLHSSNSSCVGLSFAPDLSTRYTGTLELSISSKMK